jgi:hypothetical protein
MFHVYTLVLVSGVPTFRALSPTLAYSVCIYVLVNITTYFSVRYGIITLFMDADGFEDLIYAVMMVVLLLNVVCVPVLAWFDAPKAVRYFDKWAKFQVSRVWVNIAIMGLHIDAVLKYLSLMTAVTLFHYLGLICNLKCKVQANHHYVRMYEEGMRSLNS